MTQNLRRILQLILIIIMVMQIGCKDKYSDGETVQNAQEETLYRPNFHFTPKANWMNDPNGMFYLNGTYHLYFQYYPDGNVWGPMHWGHATSKDLITWEEQPIALYPDDLGLIFSGSAVVDKNNTSGFGKDGTAPVIAMFTYHNMDGEQRGDIDFQTQGIAFSLDEGMTWTKYNGNPVISNPGIKDFRDPKVYWHAETQRWVMVLAAGQKVMFYSSPNLKDWTFESEFGEGLGSHDGVWECPDLVPMKVKNTNETTKWVLLVSINPSGPNGGSATQYFVGDFDGRTFTIDDTFRTQLRQNKVAWMDYGRDNYAGVTWSNLPESDKDPILIGWMSNWDYARDVPTYKWRSTMTIPRALQLKKQESQYILKSLPVKNLSKFVSRHIEKDTLSIDGFNALLKTESLAFDKLDMTLELNNLKEDTYSFDFFNTVGDTLSLGLNNTENYFFLDRRKSGKIDFSETFAPHISKAKLNNKLNTLKIRLLLDKTSIEVFYDDGELVMTELFFPNEPLESLQLHSEDETFSIRNLNIKELKF